MSKDAVIAAMRDVWLSNSLADPEVYGIRGRQERIRMIDGWLDYIKADRLVDFSKLFQSQLAGVEGDRACDLMDEVFVRLEIDQLIEEGFVAHHVAAENPPRG